MTLMMVFQLLLPNSESMKILKQNINIILTLRLTLKFLESS